MAASAQDLQEFRTQLLQTDGSFKQMVQEHHDLDARIDQFSRLSHLSDQEQVEETALKKKKLALKDRIEAVVRSYRH